MSYYKPTYYYKITYYSQYMKRIPISYRHLVTKTLKEKHVNTDTKQYYLKKERSQCTTDI